MSKTLETLIKVHQHQVDEQRRVVTQLEEAKAVTQQAIEDQRVQMEVQRNAARHDMELARGLPDYLHKAINRERQWQKQIIDLNGMIELARYELQNRFADLKKYEIAQNTEQEALRAERLKQENLTLDEVAGQRDQARGERNKG